MSDINYDKTEKACEIGSKGSRRKSIAAELARCAVFVVLMVVSAFISIPVQPVPFTFQTVVAVLAGLLLGKKYGTVSVAVYVFMGLIGLPVFTKGGGFAYVLNLTFGYLIGFVAAAFVAGMIRGKHKLTLTRSVLAAFGGFLANYIIGVPYFAIIWKFYMNFDGLWKAIFVNNILYMPKDIVLCVLAAVLAVKVSAALAKSGGSFGKDLRA